MPIREVIDGREEELGFHQCNKITTLSYGKLGGESRAKDECWQDKVFDLESQPMNFH